MLRNLINRLFLRKEIRSKTGTLHFKRWGVETPWFGLLVHFIARGDEDKHMHDHPFRFSSYIISGGYYEHVDGAVIPYEPGDFIRHEPGEPHRVELYKDKHGNQIPCWSFVIIGKRLPTWGYHTEKGWVENQAYRKMKHEGKL